MNGGGLKVHCAKNKDERKKMMIWKRVESYYYGSFLPFNKEKLMCKSLISME